MLKDKLRGPEQQPLVFYKEYTSGKKRIRIDERPSQYKHILRDDIGHIVDTPDNRILLENVANDASHYLGKDVHGCMWHAKILEDGQKQVWVRIREGRIINAGINQAPKIFNEKTGLSAPTRPIQKK